LDTNDRSQQQRGAYLAGLQLLARRELSEAQIRQRLARRGYPPEDVDRAIDRLRAERSLDDRRVASAIANTELRVRGRGRLRIKRQIEAAGISSAIAQDAVDAAFAEIDPDALLMTALDRRLRGGSIADDREYQRLFRYLVGQGFEPDRIATALRSRRTRAEGSHAQPQSRKGDDA
jgi:regulatory protein